MTHTSSVYVCTSLPPVLCASYAKHSICHNESCSLLHVTPQEVDQPFCKKQQHKQQQQQQQEQPSHKLQWCLSASQSQQRESFLSFLSVVNSRQGNSFCLWNLPQQEESLLSLLCWSLIVHGWHRSASPLKTDVLLYFGGSRPCVDIETQLQKECRVLHFPAYTQLTHKQRLQQNVDRQRRESGNIHLYPHYPECFSLPQQINEWLSSHQAQGGQVNEQVQRLAATLSARQTVPPTAEKIQQQQRKKLTIGGMDKTDYDNSFSVDSAAFYHAHNCELSFSFSCCSGSPSWILKPHQKGSGHGIVITDLNNHNVAETLWCMKESYVAARYIERPLLTADGYKFDLRLYAVLLSPFFSSLTTPCPHTVKLYPRFPFQVYLYQDGLCRRAALPYQHDLDSLSNPYVHLTNNSISKQLSKHHGTAQNISFQSFISTLSEHRQQRIQRQIEQCILTTLTASPSYLRDGASTRYRTTFELLGFDILIDADDKAWLCEVNSQPDLLCASSLSSPPFPVDAQVKSGLLTDLITLLNLADAGVSEQEHEKQMGSQKAISWPVHHVGQMKKLL